MLEHLRKYGENVEKILRKSSAPDILFGAVFDFRLCFIKNTFAVMKIGKMNTSNFLP
jgi:hypothetical protein